MATLKKTASGKVDKRTKEYKELVERAKKARRVKAKMEKAAAKATATATKTNSKTTASKTTTKTTTEKPKASTSSIKRRADGKIDLRTKEGKAVAERMAKARSSKQKSSGVGGLLKKLFK